MTWTVIAGDCVEVMAEMAEASVDAIVCDPPYGLEFMGKEWDRLGPVERQNDAGGGDRRAVVDPTDWMYGGEANPYSRSRVRWQHGAVGPAQMQTWHQAWATEALRVLKPGGHLLAFGGTRTYHRLTCAIEDAGFEIRDCLAWMYGSGFPKSLDVSKAIDKQRDDTAESAQVAAFLLRHNEFENVGQFREHLNREIVGTEHGGGSAQGWTTTQTSGVVKPRVPTWDQWLELKVLLALGDEMDAEVWRLNGLKGKPSDEYASRPDAGYTAAPGMRTSWTEGRGWNGNASKGGDPVRPDAARWQGWGTALKPAFEPIVMARKPLTGTVAANVLAHGTGALNIDGTRISSTPEDRAASERSMSGSAAWRKAHQSGAATIDVGDGDMTMNPSGRWPANVILDDEAAAMLDEQSGEAGGGFGKRGAADGTLQAAGWGTRNTGEVVGYGDTGGASRFFYTAKVSRAERNRGVEHMPQAIPNNAVSRADQDNEHARRPNRNPIGNTHPTVKPVDLMQWLCRLVTPPNGTVLDPFTGSGSTGIAALREGFDFIGIEREPEYVEIARSRIIGDAPLFNVQAEAQGLDIVPKGRA